MAGKLVSLAGTTAYVFGMGVRGVPVGMTKAFNAGGVIGKFAGRAIGSIIGAGYGVACKGANRLANAFRSDDNQVKSRSITEYSATIVKACEFMGAGVTGVVPGVALSVLTVPAMSLYNGILGVCHSKEVYNELSGKGSFSAASNELFAPHRFILSEILYSSNHDGEIRSYEVPSDSAEYSIKETKYYVRETGTEHIDRVYTFPSSKIKLIDFSINEKEGKVIASTTSSDGKSVSYKADIPDPFEHTFNACARLFKASDLMLPDSQRIYADDVDMEIREDTCYFFSDYGETHDPYDNNEPSLYIVKKSQIETEGNWKKQLWVLQSKSDSSDKVFFHSMYDKETGEAKLFFIKGDESIRLYLGEKEDLADYQDFLAHEYAFVALRKNEDDDKRQYHVKDRSDGA